MFNIGDRIELSGGTHETFGGPMFNRELATVHGLNGQYIFLKLDNGATMKIDYYFFSYYFDEIYQMHGNGD